MVHSSSDSEPLGAARVLTGAPVESRTAPRVRHLFHPTEAHPLGPLLSTTVSTARWKTRLVASAVMLGAGLLLGVAAWLKPDPSGMGTHRQLGLSSCSLPMLTGYPCPSCGMTTAFAHAVRGQFIDAFMAQPAGLCVALATGVVVMLAGYSAVTGRSWCINWYRIPARWLTLGVIGVILGAWGFKVVVGLARGTIPWG